MSDIESVASNTSSRLIHGTAIIDEQTNEVQKETKSVKSKEIAEELALVFSTTGWIVG